jgi:GntR family transcriptional regulator, vanillate catabolism transcriptional regulator
MTADARAQTEHAVLTLREMLLRGDFKPGARLSELALLPTIKASRTQVRIALERLTQEGLLEALPTTGFRVRGFALNDIWDAIEIRGVLEGTAARLAAERLTSADELGALRLHCRQAEELLPMTRERFARYAEINEAFHAGLWRLAKSAMLRRAIEQMITLPFTAPGALVFSWPDPREGNDEAIIAIEHHRAIVEAIELHEAARAESLAREHARLARRALKRALENAEPFRGAPGATLVNWTE